MQGRTSVWHASLLGLAGCGSDVVNDARGGSGGAGGNGSSRGATTSSEASGGGGGAGSIAATTASTAASTVVATSTVGPAPVSASSGSSCASELFASAGLNACANESCCDEMEACAEDPSSCGIAGDEIDPSTADALELYECLVAGECLAYEVCDSGLVFPDRESAECLSDACCVEISACTRDGADVEACVLCMEDAPQIDNELCEDVLECVNRHCWGIPENYVEICESELVTFDDWRVECLEEHCCEPYEACTNRGESEAAVADCWDCFNQGGGPLCDAAIACDVENCDPTICGSGVAVSDLELSACLEEQCCDAFMFCTGGNALDEEAVEACLDCFSEDGGPLCDDAIACADEYCGGI